MPAGPPALIISGLAELAKISEVERMTIAKTLTVGLVLWWLWLSRILTNCPDYVCAVAVHLLYNYGGDESLRGGVRSEITSSFIVE